MAEIFRQSGGYSIDRQVASTDSNICFNGFVVVNDSARAHRTKLQCGQRLKIGLTDRRR